MASIPWWGRVGLLLLVGLAYSAPPGTFRKIDFEFTGTVRDEQTQEPLEGAYVVAVYSYVAGEYGVSAIKCKKTLGMFTGKDGKFHFPVEKLDASSPGDITAIKPGYFGSKRVLPKLAAVRQQRAEAYTDRDYFLTKQSPEKPELLFGDRQEVCVAASSREDVAASIQFLKIKLAEVKRLGGLPWSVEDIERNIAWFEVLPTAGKK